MRLTVLSSYIGGENEMSANESVTPYLVLNKIVLNIEGDGIIVDRLLS